MWNWLNCYLSGRHEFGITCEPGTVFLRCLHCGKRSPGWAIEGGTRTLAPATQRPTEAARRPLPFSPRSDIREVKSA
jgi:hypothetical protein